MARIKDAAFKTGESFTIGEVEFHLGSMNGKNGTGSSFFILKKIWQFINTMKNGDRLWSILTLKGFIDINAIKYTLSNGFIKMTFPNENEISFRIPTSLEECDYQIKGCYLTAKKIIQSIPSSSAVVPKLERFCQVTEQLYKDINANGMGGNDDYLRTMRVMASELSDILGMSGLTDLVERTLKHLQLSLMYHYQSINKFGNCTGELTDLYNSLNSIKQSEFSKILEFEYSISEGYKSTRELIDLQSQLLSKCIVPGSSCGIIEF